MATKENELTTEQKLHLLYDLQKVYSKIDELRVLLGELPGEVKDMGDEVEGLKCRLSNIKKEIEDLENHISEKKVQTETANAMVSRYKEQQENVRNNREYDNLSKEIEYQTLEIELCQKRIKEYSAALEQKQAEKQKTMTEIEERTIDLKEKEHELDDI